MTFDFETLVERKKASLNEWLTEADIKAAGNISFVGAEPWYPTAPAIRDAVRRMADNGLFGYTIMDRGYQQAVVRWMKDVRGFDIEPEWIVPTLGTIFSVASTVRLLTDENDSIIVTPPIYNRYEQAATRLNRNTLKCPLIIRDGRYSMDFTAIEKAMSRKDVKLFILCNPHNPIGQIWSRFELEKLAALAERYDVHVFSDEIFAENSVGGRSCPSYLTIPGAEKHTLVATSLGKAFGTTGFNHANILISDHNLREAFTECRARDHYGSMDPVVYESLLAAYTPEGWAWVSASNKVIERNMTAVKEFFEFYLPEVPIFGGEGGYILWMDWRKYFKDEAALMEFLIHKAFLHLDVGSVYGAEGFTRMSLACPSRCVEAALSTLKMAIENKGNGIC
jgi:cystathionine beta-lyase